MAASWPSAKKTFSQIIDGITKVIGICVNTVYDETEALQTYLGASGNAQTKLAALNRLFKYQLNPLPQITWIDADTIEIAACAVAMHNGSNYVFKENTLALQIKLSVDLDTGSEAANTWYDVYLIGDGSGSTYTAKFVLQGNTPSGATYYKKINSFLNNSSSNLEKFYHFGNKVVFADVVTEDGTANAEVKVLNAGTQTSFTAIDCSAKIPAIASCASFMAITAGAGGVALRTYNSGATAGYGVYQVSGGCAFFPDIPLSSDIKIDYKIRNATNVSIFVKDYTINIR